MSQGALENLVVLVTGGNRGIGAAIAVQCALRGAAVVATARSAKTFPSALEPGAVAMAPLDVREERSVLDFFDWIDRSVGKVDVLVNNAGTSVWKPVDQISLDEWRAVIDTNLTGVFLCSREAMRRMKRAGGGRIITIGSIADRTPLADCGAYGASKYGARGLSEVVTEEGKAFRVFGTLVSLGAVATEVWSGRSGFDTRDMLSPADVGIAVAEIAARPLSVRIDEVRLGPPKGIL